MVAKSEWLKRPIKAGSETERAHRHGRSLEAQAKIDEHSSDPKVRGKGVFAMNAREHKFKHAGKRTRSRA